MGEALSPFPYMHIRAAEQKSKKHVQRCNVANLAKYENRLQEHDEISADIPTLEPNCGMRRSASMAKLNDETHVLMDGAVNVSRRCGESR